MGLNGNADDRNRPLPWGPLVAIVILFAIVMGGMWAGGQNLRTEVRRVTLHVESVEYGGGFAEGRFTILHLKGGGTYLLDGLRSVPSGDVTISVRRSGDHVVVTP